MSEEEPKADPLPEGWKRVKLGDVADISGEGVTLHPTKGANPFITTCRYCGKEVGLVLLGIRDYIDTCKRCGTSHIGGMEKQVCMKCEDVQSFDRRRLKYGETIPSDLCPECKLKLEATNKLVAEGGIYFKCKCGSMGAIKADAPIAKMVRERSQTPTGPVGVNLDSCPGCQPETKVHQPRVTPFTPPTQDCQ